ncbi:hypothetical protein RvY_18116 [Ramazzottius varieornatus]|uniref:Vacuolar ATPase assembly integral membrane protein VMA21 homolog n=1 Tax=Ramazzottius varieornatus TaxID=947166 RepID=A0A1D1W4L2_RAMVA|nr:hypothetical protein RvY_18116 [Ramazzottius varieornatus]
MFTSSSVVAFVLSLPFYARSSHCRARFCCFSPAVGSGVSRTSGSEMSSEQPLLGGMEQASNKLTQRTKSDKTASDGQAAQLTLVTDEEVTSIFAVLIRYTLMIIFIPILTYFGGKKYILEDIMGFSSRQSFIYWAVIAVISIHVVLAVMVYRAYREGLKPRTLKKD